MLKKITFLILTLVIGLISFSQESNSGIIAGNVLDDKGKAVQSATVELIKLEDSLQKQTILTDCFWILSASNQLCWDADAQY